ncbi:MAG TPA: hypothetical protein VII41_10605 [Steroidobacteraceae bacterium]
MQRAAATVTFGTNLAQQPNAPLKCSEGVLNQFLGQFIFGPFSGDCMWSSIVVGSIAESLTAPASGTVTTVRVRIGAETGPMQVNVVRFLFRQTGDPAKPELACCFLEAYGPVFTPTPNAITTVATNLPVTVEATPPPNDTTTIAATDQLALASLNPGVQVPLFATKGGENDPSVLSYAWYPAPSAPGVPAPSPNPLGGFADMSGFKVLMNADLDTGGGAPPGPAPAPAGPTPPPAPPAAIPAFVLPRLTVPVRGGMATVPIQCLVLDCSGLIALQSAQQAGAASAANKQAPRIISYGTARFSLKAGTTGKVKVKLNAAGRRLVRSHRRATVWANVRFTSGAGSAKSARVTLKR